MPTRSMRPVGRPKPGGRATPDRSPTGKSGNTPFGTDARIPATYKDGAIAITATDSRVAVTWVSRKTALGQNDTTGGYAIFACK